MGYAETLEEIIVRAPTPSSAGTALRALQSLAHDGDVSAARALGAALAMGLRYDDAAPRLREARSLQDLLADGAIPPLLRMYVMGFSPRDLLMGFEACAELAVVVRATDEFRRFQRLVRQGDLLEHEGLKAYILSAFISMYAYFNSGSLRGMLPSGGLALVLDRILADGRVVPGAAADMGFSFGRDKLLEIGSASALFAIIQHELGHHVFDLARAGGPRTGISAAKPESKAASAESPGATEPLLKELIAHLPGMLRAVHQMGAAELKLDDPRRVRLSDDVSLLGSVNRGHRAPYLHLSLNRSGDPIPLPMAADWAVLALELLGADPNASAAGYSPRGVFHFGVLGEGPVPDALARSLQKVNVGRLLDGLRLRSTGWLAALKQAGRLGPDGESVAFALGLRPPPRRFYPPDPAIWEDLETCRLVYASARENSTLQVAKVDVDRLLETIVRCGEEPLVRAILEGGVSAAEPGSAWIVRAGSSLGILDDRDGTTPRYVGPTADRIFAVIRALHQHGADLNAPIDGDGTTLLLEASRRSPEAARLFLELGAEVRLADKRGVTPLHGASESDRPDIVTALLDAGAEVDAQEVEGVTPLARASALGDAEAVARLLERGADPDAADHHGTRPLMLVPDLKTARRLLDHGADPDATDHAGMTALMRAAWRELPEVVRALLDAHADPNAATDLGETALHYAALAFDGEAQRDCLAALIDAGVDVDEETNEGVTPLMVAARNGRVGALRCLLSRGANVHARTITGHTPLFMACDPQQQFSRDFTWSDRMEKSVRALVEARADLNAGDGESGTALHNAASFFDAGPLKLLIELGAKAEVRTREGLTPLMIAASHGHFLMVELLISAGAAVNAVDGRGDAPLIHVVRAWPLEFFGHDNLPGVIDQLLDAGADPRLANVAGETARTLAKNLGLPKAVRSRLAASPAR